METERVNKCHVDMRRIDKRDALLGLRVLVSATAFCSFVADGRGLAGHGTCEDGSVSSVEAAGKVMAVESQPASKCSKAPEHGPSWRSAAHPRHATRDSMTHNDTPYPTATI